MYLTGVAKAALTELYVEAQSKGLLTVMQAAAEQEASREEILDSAAYLLTKHAINQVDDAMEYYRAIAEVAPEYPDLIHAMTKAKLTSFKNIDVSIPIGEDFQASLGWMLVEGYAKDDARLETLEQRAPLIAEMLKLYDNEHMSIQRSITIGSIRRNIIDAPFSPQSPGHLTLRKLAFNGELTGADESREMLESIMLRMLGSKSPDPKVFAEELARIELNPRYIKKYLESDFSFFLSRVHTKVSQDEDSAKLNLSKPNTLIIFNQFKAFISKHEMDATEMSWCLYANKSPSMAQQCAERLPGEKDYASLSMLSMLSDGDMFGGVDDAQSYFAKQWLKSLTPQQALSLKADDKCLLKLYTIRGEKALLNKIKSVSERDRVIGIDLGL
ncbi:Uncharacterized protein AC499_0727 [Pseudomonas amygdali pv. lachrymans]|nr:Uncharacterized protein AC499_0727 [Pseudomonas amygdali pv. lachrymans]